MDYFPIIDVFLHVLKAVPSARLVLAGGLSEEKNEYLTELQTYAVSRGITDQIILYPNFEPDHKHLLYSSADIFISPSDNLQETFGISILEALASGLPVICSDWNGYKELVEDGVTGYKIRTIMQQNNEEIDKYSLFSINPAFTIAQHTAVDQEQMQDRIVFLLSNPDKLKEMSEQALKAAEPYDWSAIIPRFETLWTSLKTKVAVRKPGTFSLHFPFYKLFSHYPTTHLNDDHQLAITDKGINMLYDREDVPVNRTMSAYLNFQLVSTLLLMLSKQPLTLKAIKERTGFKGETVESHILWLLKHGALTLS